MHFSANFQSKTSISLYLNDAQATDKLGCQLAPHLKAGLVIFLEGDLGAGKTALTRALIHATGYVGHVKSPTYTLAEPYEIKLNGQVITLMHFDLYRMSSPDEFIEAGFRDAFNDSTICMIEWAEKGAGVLPQPDIVVQLQVEGVGRRAQLLALTDKGKSCIEQVNFL